MFALREQHQKTGNYNAPNSLWRMRFSVVKYALSLRRPASPRSSYPLQVAELSLYVVQRCDAGSFEGWMYIRDKRVGKCAVSAKSVRSALFCLEAYVYIYIYLCGILVCLTCAFLGALDYFEELWLIASFARKILLLTVWNFRLVSSIVIYVQKNTWRTISVI